MNDGAIELEAVNGTAEHLVEWDNFMEGAQIDSLPPGTYNYIYTDTNLCQATGSIFIQQPLALSMLLFPFPEVEGDDGSVSLIINGGTTPYTIYLNGIETEGTVISGLSAGDYIVLIVDANGCEIQQKFTIDNTTSILGLSESQNVLFPNPVVNGQSIQLSLKDAHSLKSITIFDASGKKIHMLTGFSGGNFQTLNLPDLKSGWYYLLLRYANNEEDKLPLLIVDRE